MLSATLPLRDVRTNGRVRRTSLTRTVADCLRHLSTVDAVAVADAALRQRPTAWSGVQRVLDECAGWPLLRRGAAAWTLVDGRRESPLESWSWVAAARQGLPLPEPQVQVFDEHGLFLGRVDAWWPEHGVVGEVDGLGKYGTGTASGDPDAVRRAVQRVLEKKGGRGARRTASRCLRSMSARAARRAASAAARAARSRTTRPGTPATTAPGG